MRARAIFSHMPEEPSPLHRLYKVHRHPAPWAYKPRTACGNPILEPASRKIDQTELSADQPGQFVCCPRANVES